MLEREAPTLLRAQDQQQGRVPVSHQRSGRQHRHRRQRMGNRGAQARIEGMRITLAILLEIIAVVTRRGHPVPLQRQHLLGYLQIVARQFECNAPGTAIGFAPHCLELTGSFHQKAFDPQSLHPCHDQVDRMPGGDAVEVDLDASVLAQLLAFDTQVGIPHPLAHLRQPPGIGHLLFTRLGPEAPQVEQRLHREIEGPVTLARELLTYPHKLQHVGRHRLAAVGGQLVELPHLLSDHHCKIHHHNDFDLKSI